MTRPTFKKLTWTALAGVLVVVMAATALPALAAPSGGSSRPAPTQTEWHCNEDGTCACRAGADCLDLIRENPECRFWGFDPRTGLQTCLLMNDDVIVHPESAPGDEPPERTLPTGRTVEPGDTGTAALPPEAGSDGTTGDPEDGPESPDDGGPESPHDTVPDDPEDPSEPTDPDPSRPTDRVLPPPDLPATDV